MKSPRALLNRIIDYAGLFPPAKLDMRSTVANYARYLDSDDAWMLGRLIIPAARLDEFEQHAAELLSRGDDAADKAWQISALSAASGSTQLDTDLAVIESFNGRHAEPDNGAAIIDVIELRSDSAAAIDAALDEIPDELFPFFEMPIENDPRGLIATLVDGDAGAKVRTGGVSADAYPTPANLARFISACAAANVPFKATAGLHHPLRHFSGAVQTREFGFLNVFIAACLARLDEIAQPEVLALLEEESPQAFKFEDDSIEWRGHRIRADDIEDVREDFAVSFGSCSFDEPLEDLRSLRLL